MADRTHQLREGIAALERQRAELRDKEKATTALLAKQPTSAALIDDVLSAGREMHRIDIVLNALRAELEGVEAVAKEAARAAAIAAVADRKESVIKRSAERVKQAQRVQDAGEALIAAVTEWRAAGVQIHNDARAVLTAHHGDLDRVASALMFVGPAAAGTGADHAEGISSIAVRVLKALGSAHTDSFVVVNAYQQPRLNFADAAQRAHDALVDRFKGLEPQVTTKKAKPSPEPTDKAAA